MKRFRYRLQRVLRYRELVQAERKRVLLEQRIKLASLNEQLGQLKEAQSSNEKVGGSFVDVSMLALVVAYAERIKEQIAQKQGAISEQEQVVEQALKEYVEASKDAKALELHRQRKSKEYEEYVEREESKVIDEQTVQKFGRLSSFGD